LRLLRIVAVLTPFALVGFLVGFCFGDLFGAFIGVAVGCALALALTGFVPDEWLAWLNPPCAQLGGGSGEEVAQSFRHRRVG